MAPSRHEHPGPQTSDGILQSRQSSRNAEPMIRSVGTPQRLCNEESWIEISSQPSSSSLSSNGDEIVTTGLRVQQDPYTRRGRRAHPGFPSHRSEQASRASTSSQEEYEESDSEEDRILSSSNENISPAPRLPALIRQGYDAGSESDDDDENATALGRVTDEPVFTPQPNAFSHPPSSQNIQRPVSGSYFPRTSQPAPYSRPSYSHRSTSRAQHSSYNTTSYQADHDAALRASLTTLLSCAAAARGLPKRNQSNLGGGNTVSGNEPMGLRLVPESELVAPSANLSRPLSPSTRARSSPSISSQEAAEKGKRKATTTKPAGQPRATKKKKVALVEEAMISPTLLTWVVSAGVVVLVSVVGFGAGYVIGREVGRQEALSGLNSSTLVDSASCSRDVVRSSSGLRRFKWGSGVARVIVA